MKEFIRNTTILMCITYFIFASMFGIYYNYLYAVEHGFWSWFFFGEIIATCKAIVWPYFVFFGS